MLVTTGFRDRLVLDFLKVIQNGVKPFLNEIVKKSCFHVDLQNANIYIAFLMLSGYQK